MIVASLVFRIAKVTDINSDTGHKTTEAVANKGIASIILMSFVDIITTGVATMTINLMSFTYFDLTDFDFQAFYLRMGWINSYYSTRTKNNSTVGYKASLV
jgi:hypothetical protein